jgi:hypothetical protein
MCRYFYTVESLIECKVCSMYSYEYLYGFFCMAERLIEYSESCIDFLSNCSVVYMC